MVDKVFPTVFWPSFATIDHPLQFFPSLIFSIVWDAHPSKFTSASQTFLQTFPRTRPQGSCSPAWSSPPPRCTKCCVGPISPLPHRCPHSQEKRQSQATVEDSSLAFLDQFAWEFIWILISFGTIQDVFSGRITSYRAFELPNASF